MLELKGNHVVMIHVSYILLMSFQTRSISSELSNPAETSAKDREDPIQSSYIRPASNGETSRDKFYSPKSSSLSQDDQDSPVVGVRRSRVPRDEPDAGSPGVNDRQSSEKSEASTTQSGPLNAVESEDKDDDDDEQGPEPEQGETLENEALRNASDRGCGVILERYSIVFIF